MSRIKFLSKHVRMKKCRESVINFKLTVSGGNVGKTNCGDIDMYMCVYTYTYIYM
jgi:hypothetical protein